MADIGNILQNPVRKIRETLPRFVSRDFLNLPEGRYVSICFDDFPKSAVKHAGAELRQRGWQATWYAAGGLMDTHHEIYGEMFDADDLAQLMEEGHEIGCHTHSHLDCLAADADEILEDFDRNRVFFEEQGLPPAKSFAYPYGSADITAKRVLMDRLPVLRGVRPGLLQGTADRGLLTATGIEDHNGGTARALEQLQQLKADDGWLIIFTHDIRDDPSPWGCTLEDFRHVLDTVEETGAEVLTVASMLERMDAPDSVTGLTASQG